MDRRNFLNISGLAVTSIAAGVRPVVIKAEPDIKPVSVGVIGTGSRGNWLIKIMNDIPGLKVVACCDTLPFHLERGIELAGKNVSSFKNYKAMLDRQDIEAIIIATPLSEHYQMAIDAMDAGKHVYCEKTLTYSIEEAIKLREKVKATPELVFQVGFQYRYQPLLQQIKEGIDKDYYGTITHIETHYNRNHNWRRPVPDPQYERAINWRMYSEFSGGLMAELCSHQIDITNFLLDGHFQKVTGFGGIDYWKDGRETFDNVFSVFEYPRGVKVSYHSITTNAFEDFNIKIYGTKATVLYKGEEDQEGFIYPEGKIIEEMQYSVDAVTGATLKRLKAGEPIPFAVQGLSRGDYGISSAALNHFIKCIRKGDKPISNIDYGFNAAVAVHKANKAMRDGTIEYWTSE